MHFYSSRVTMFSTRGRDVAHARMQQTPSILGQGWNTTIEFHVCSACINHLHHTKGNTEQKTSKGTHSSHEPSFHRQGSVRSIRDPFADPPNLLPRKPSRSKTNCMMSLYRNPRIDAPNKSMTIDATEQWAGLTEPCVPCLHHI